eukprot:m.94800 g.94800  ORF g.94800 m.94800 type:complete len:378 (+) comp16570_c0_seq1:169-1302(+)
MNSLNLNFQSVVDTNCWLPERFVGDDSAGFWGFSMTDAIIVFHDKLTYVRKALSSTPELSVSFSTVVAVSPSFCRNPDMVPLRFFSAITRLTAISACPTPLGPRMFRNSMVRSVPRLLRCLLPLLRERNDAMSCACVTLPLKIVVAIESTDATSSTQASCPARTTMPSNRSSKLSIEKYNIGYEICSSDILTSMLRLLGDGYTWITFFITTLSLRVTGSRLQMADVSSYVTCCSKKLRHVHSSQLYLFPEIGGTGRVDEPRRKTCRISASFSCPAPLLLPAVADGFLLSIPLVTKNSRSSAWLSVSMKNDLNKNGQAVLSIPLCLSLRSARTASMSSDKYIVSLIFVNNTCGQRQHWIICLCNERHLISATVLTDLI